MYSLYLMFLNHICHTLIVSKLIVQQTPLGELYVSNTNAHTTIMFKCDIRNYLSICYSVIYHVLCKILYLDIL